MIDLVWHTQKSFFFLKKKLKLFKKPATSLVATTAINEEWSKAIIKMVFHLNEIMISVQKSSDPPLRLDDNVLNHGK